MSPPPLVLHCSEGEGLFWAPSVWLRAFSPSLWGKTCIPHPPPPRSLLHFSSSLAYVMRSLNVSSSTKYESHILTNFKQSFTGVLACCVACNTSLHPNANLCTRLCVNLEVLILKIDSTRARASEFTNVYNCQQVLPIRRGNHLLTPYSVDLLNQPTQGCINFQTLFLATCENGVKWLLKLKIWENIASL